MDQTSPSNEAPKPAEYNAASITVLEGLEAVRKRPGMYIGDTFFRGLHHLVYEVVDNSVDEALAGFATQVNVFIHVDNSITVVDDGRGIPVGPHPTVPGMDTLDVVMTKLHAGGKFENSAYKVSGGLHGVGVSCVNALSELMKVEVQRGGKVYNQTYARGIPQGQVKEVGVTEKRGVGLVQSQRHNPHYVAEIDALLDRLGGHYNRKTARNGEMVCWQLRKPLWLKIHAALPGKVVTPALVASLTIPQMRLFIDTFTKGDGHFPEEGGNTITQRLRENLDALQAMAVLSGITSTVYYQVGAHDFGSIYLAKNSVRSHVKAMVESAERTVDTVWCPQTGSGCWIARRNGRTFVTGNSNRPQWARGPVGATVMTFKQFSISYLEFLSRLPRREKAIALGVLTLAAGLEGLPFADDLDDLIDTIMQRLFGKAFSAKRAKVEALTAMGMSRDSAEWVLRGASALPGFPVDLAGRMSLGNMIPGTGVLRTDGAKDKSAEVLEALGPAGGVVRDALRGEFSPVAVRNAVKGAEMFRTGQYRDELGRKVADVDGADAAAKALGFQPREIARESRGSRMAQSVVAQTRAAESDIVRLWAQGIADNEPDKVAEARAQLEAWNQRNPEARIAINRMQIARQVRDMRATREERLIRATPKELRGRVAQELQQ